MSENSPQPSVSDSPSPAPDEPASLPPKLAAQLTAEQNALLEKATEKASELAVDKSLALALNVAVMTRQIYVLSRLAIRNRVEEVCGEDADEQFKSVVEEVLAGSVLHAAAKPFDLADVLPRLGGIYSFAAAEHARLSAAEIEQKAEERAEAAKLRLRTPVPIGFAVTKIEDQALDRLTSTILVGDRQGTRWALYDALNHALAAGFRVLHLSARFAPEGHSASYSVIGQPEWKNLGSSRKKFAETLMSAARRLNAPPDLVLVDDLSLLMPPATFPFMVGNQANKLVRAFAQEAGAAVLMGWPHDELPDLGAAAFETLRTYATLRPVQVLAQEDGQSAVHLGRDLWRWLVSPEALSSV